MGIRLDNPYRDLSGQWIRGSFHGHCSEHSACASVPLAESVRRYSEVGAGFVALTDHDVVTDLAPMQARYGALAFLHGFEYSTRENVVFVGSEVGPLYELELEEALMQAGELLTVVCHPQPEGPRREYWTLEKLTALGVWPDGLEVYNGHYGIERALAAGRWPLYADFWDELLTAGHRLWGFANDDFHDVDDFGNAFNMVLVEEATPQAVVAAAKCGRSYASTGLLLVSVEAAGAAEAGGLFMGDTLVSLGGNPLRHLDDLLGNLGGDSIGKQISARVLRGGQLIEVTLSPAAHS